MQRVGLSLLAIIWSCCILAQADTTAFTVSYTIPGQFVQMSIDRMGQPLLLDANNKLYKYDAQGKFQFLYSNARLGDITALEATNPFTILLYFADFQNIVQLDRTLGERATLDLRRADLANVTAIARSTDDNIWVYDDWNYRLRKIDASGTVLLQSDDLQLRFGDVAAATRILVDRAHVYVRFPEHGIAVFDNFGQWEQTIFLPSATQLIQLLGERMILARAGKYYLYSPETESEQQLPVPAVTPSALRQINWLGDQIFLLTTTGLTVYRRTAN